jgi:ribonuclease Y
MNVINILIVIVGLALGLFLGYYLRKLWGQKKLESAEKQAQEIIASAQKETEALKKEGALQTRDETLKARATFEKETRAERQELKNFERRLLNREENLERKLDLLEKKDAELAKREKSTVAREQAADEKDKKCTQTLAEAREKLEKLAGLTATEAKKILLESMEGEARLEAQKIAKKIEEEAKEGAERNARRIVALATQKYSGDYAAEKMVSVVNLPNEDMKGRIIGREGRNIRALESLTGVDLIIDDTPEAVVLSAHSPIRREVARLSLEKLIQDGRIHPGRIEEVVDKAEKEIEASLVEDGERAAFDLGVHGLHAELVKLLGRLKFRTSYAQNIYQHSMEVAFISGIIAAELGLDTKLARRVGLLHDIGKAVDHEVEGSHAMIGLDLAQKYGEKKDVLEAIRTHHDDEPSTVYGNIVQAADTLSAARPGARREMYEAYIKRLEDLEKIASEFPGVEKCYSIQAGREIRVIVESQKISDEASHSLAKEMARRIEGELTYPGQIKVTVIRENRAVEYAK